MLARIETTTQPKLTIIDRYFDICQIIKSKTMLRAVKDLLRNRLNIPMKCPFKRGLSGLNVEYQMTDIFVMLRAADEIRRFVPGVNMKILKYTFNMHFSLHTKFHNIDVSMGRLDVNDLGCTNEALTKFVKILFFSKE